MIDSENTTQQHGTLDEPLRAYYRAVPKHRFFKRKKRKEVCTELSSWWNDGQPGSTLDLSPLSRCAVRDIPAEVMALIAPHIKHLLLPSSLNNNTHQPPEWLSLLHNIEHLTVPDYQSNRLDLRQFLPNAETDEDDARRCKLEVGGNIVRTIDASTQARIYSPEAAEEVRVNARYYAADGSMVGSETAMGYIRLVTPNNDRAYVEVNNSFEAQFDTNTWIACRHLAIKDITIRQAHRANQSSGQTSNGNHASRLLEEVGTPDLIKKNVSPVTNTIHRELLTKGTELYLVDHQQWGTALRAIAEKMSNNSVIQFLLSTGSHALSLYLHSKETAWGDVRYVMVLADSNRNLIYKRQVVHSPNEFESRTLQTLMADSRIELFYGRLACTLFVAVPQRLYQCVDDTGVTRLFEEEAGKTRYVTEFLSGENEVLEGKRFYWLRYGLPLEPTAFIERQFKALQACRTFRDRFNLLACRDSDDIPGRYYALQNNHSGPLEADNKLLILARQNNLIDNDELFELLAARRVVSVDDLSTSSVSGRYFANQETIRVDNEMLFRARENDWIGDYQLMALMAARDSNNIPARYWLLKRGYTDTFIADNELLNLLGERELINNYQIMEHMRAVSPRGASGRYAAIENGRAAIIRADNKQLIHSWKNRWLNDRQFLELLIPPDVNGQSAFSTAEKSGFIEACKVQGGAILYAYGEGLLSNERLDTLTPNTRWLEKHCPLEYMAATIQRELRQHFSSIDAGTSGAPSSPKEQLFKNISALLTDIYLPYEVATQSELNDTSWGEVFDVLSDIKKHLANFNTLESAQKRAQLLRLIKQNFERAIRLAGNTLEPPLPTALLNKSSANSLPFRL